MLVLTRIHRQAHIYMNGLLSLRQSVSVSVSVSVLLWEGRLLYSKEEIFYKRMAQTYIKFLQQLPQNDGTTNGFSFP